MNWVAYTLQLSLNSCKLVYKSSIRGVYPNLLSISIYFPATPVFSFGNKMPDFSLWRIYGKGQMRFDIYGLKGEVVFFIFRNEGSRSKGERLRRQTFKELKIPMPNCHMVFFHMGVSKNRGTPKWMVYNGKPC